MNLREAKKLSNGVYALYWKDGGWSLASVGRTYDGTPWFAPTNWIGRTEKAHRSDGTQYNYVIGVASIDWRAIQHATPLRFSIGTPGHITRGV